VTGADAVAPDGPGTGDGGADTLNVAVVIGLFTLFGDAKGDGVINAFDFAQFRTHFGSGVP
jgi:hypothetical protein